MQPLIPILLPSNRSRTKGVYYPFSDTAGNEVLEVRVKGTVVDGNLKSDVKYSHTISFDLGENSDEIEYIKSLASQAPKYNKYETVVKFSPKEDLKNAFADIWEIGDERMLGNYDLRKPIHFEKVTPREMAWVEFTVVPYAAIWRNSMKVRKGRGLSPES
jgi:hypothetical protein